MKKLFCILFLLMLLALMVTALAADVPTMDDPGDLYCNDGAPTFVFHWKPDSKIQIVKYCAPTGPYGHSTSYYNYVYETDTSGMFKFQPDNDIAGSGEGYVRVCGLISNDGENNVWTDSVDCTFTVKAESMIVPTVTVPDKLQPGQDLVITMPQDDMELTYSPRLRSRDTNHSYAQRYDEEPWKAGQTYTIPGEYLPEADVYYLTFYVEKARCNSETTAQYVIAVGDVDIREPIYIYLSTTEIAKNAFMLLHQNGIIQLQLPYTNWSDAIKTSVKPARLRLSIMQYGGYPSNHLAVNFAAGDIPEYFLAGASEVEAFFDENNGLLLQESQADAVSGEKRVGLYSVDHTLAELYAELDLTAPEPFDQVDISTLGEVTFVTPDSLRIIENEAFRDIDAKVVRITDDVTSIGNLAFADSSLQQIIIPASVTEIADNAFDGCGEFVVFCYEGSYAQEWVMSHRFALPIKYGLMDAE